MVSENKKEAGAVLAICCKKNEFRDSKIRGDLFLQVSLTSIS